MSETERIEEKKRWYFVRESSGGYAVLSKVFYAHDEKYLYERSGKRTPRKSSWRTWYDSETNAVGMYFSAVGRWIKSKREEVARLERLEKSLALELNRLIDAEYGGKP